MCDMNDETKIEPPSVSWPEPVISRPDPLSVAEAMKCWRELSGDAVALARTLVTNRASSQDCAMFFVNAAKSASEKILIDELTRLYEVEKQHKQLQLDMETVQMLLNNSREEIQKLVTERQPVVKAKKSKKSGK